jgi:demethylmenaquinone methyltransferase / 2-methoxy-6-polyprenyl-1,4-benzoquinol methylase
MLAAAAGRHEVASMSVANDERADETQARLAASGSSEKRRFVQAMFSDIAPRYDLLNHLLSFNVDRRWRRRAIRALGWERDADGTYLDLCAGTLDVSVELARQHGFRGRVMAADFAEPMLRAGRDKVLGAAVHAVAADALTLPLPDSSCAGAIVAFGVRNLADLDAGLREVARVLTPGARFVILEFTTPRSAIIRSGYHLYFHHVLPRVGALISGNRGAYRYLPESVARFPLAAALAERMQSAGFRDVMWVPLTLGIAAIHVGIRA